MAQRDKCYTTVIEMYHSINNICTLVLVGLGGNFTILEYFHSALTTHANV